MIQKVCAAEGCGAILSRFNADDLCWLHRYGPITRPVCTAVNERVRQCWNCFAPLVGKRSDARFCTEVCQRRSRYRLERRIAVRALAAARRGRICDECGDEVPVTKKRYKGKILSCSIRCYQRWYQRERQRHLRAAAKA